MYWDIVEVKPEPDYCLHVRFKDGPALAVRPATGARHVAALLVHRPQAGVLPTHQQILDLLLEKLKSSPARTFS